MPRLEWGLTRNLKAQYRLVEDAKAERRLHWLPTNSMDVFGVSLSYVLLNPITHDHHNLRFPNTANMIDPARHPFILCTTSTKFTPTEPYRWVTFSPYSICQIDDGAYIPAHALNSRFKNGTSTDVVPPFRMGYALGAFGSAFSANARDAYEKSAAVKGMVHKFFSDEKLKQLGDKKWANNKFTAVRTPNFTYGMEGTRGEHSEWLTLIDGGYLNNVPLEPLINQHDEPFDLVIVLDSNKNAEARLRGIRRSLDACKARGYNLAPLADDDVIANTMTVSHGTSDQTSILYVSLEPDVSFDPKFNIMKDRRYRTTNFFYKESTARQIIDSLRHVITSRKDTIIDAIARVARKVEDDVSSDVATVATVEMQEDQMLLEEKARPSRSIPTHGEWDGPAAAAAAA
jgi:hypothetical protein